MTPLDALTAALVAEHAAVYAYGVVGAHLSGPERDEARRAFDSHRARRDQLEGALRQAGRPVPGTSPAYDTPAGGRAEALALAVRVEEGLAGRWRDLVAAGGAPQLRAIGVAGLRETAVRATSWRLLAGTRPATVALPGA